ncbi:methylthioribulose-1-phosphate dehydratase [Leptospira fainei serovar Hurstbridge str. BUT 6]|uniref:Methylthioribulose-1-phosphate dehydratase n=1 Tax=Leptospira fainei serovar Hurstbridge str. BUT 6 TaxID=1193011 RepID=S3UQ02_9LEPT|nr:methylthioribulose 1-phosphate dehydratase [Leptospira fainei]EPG72481.1 methylthioribulose-1-phosphate dehydratase [Leptospira fainei serovar Hurstbridge str. BUT 6]
MSIKKELSRLAKSGVLYHSKGWMPGTAGNLSLRDLKRPDVFWVSGSGLDKNLLSKKDFLPVDIETGKVIEGWKGREGLKPSAETSIHRAVYKAFPEIGCSLHVHTPESNLIKSGVTRESPVQEWNLPSLEIIKAFGIWDESPQVFAPVVYNFPVVQEISDALQAYLEEKKPKVPLCVIENHGITVWGKDLTQANRHLEAADFILKVRALSR